MVESNSKNQKKNEEVNKEWEKAHEPSHDYSKASKSKITTPEEEAEEKRRKLKLLDDMVTAKLDEKMEDLKAHINQEFKNYIAQVQGQPQAQQAQQTQQAAPNMPPEIKAEAIAKIGGVLAELVKAWKGTGSAPTDDYFGQMSKNMMLQIIQAGLDGIFKNVYPTYNPPPPNVQRFEPVQPTAKPPGKVSFE